MTGWDRFIGNEVSGIMKAVVIRKDKRSIEIQEVLKPTVQPGTLLLKTLYCAICGSDIEYLDGALQDLASFEAHAGVILGHEWVAEIAAVGEGVSGWSAGDRVAYSPTKRTCGVCYFCRRFMYHLCIGGSSRGSVFGGQSYGLRGGAMAEYFIKAASLVQPVPENVSSEEACLAEPLATGIGSVNAAGLGLGKSAVIIGAGKIGLGAMLCADAGPDAVLICVREGTVLSQATQMVRLGGTIALTGFVNPMEVDPRIWVEKQLTIKGHISGPVKTALNLMENKLVDVRPLISEIMPLEDAQRGFDSIRSGENIAVLLKP